MLNPGQRLDGKYDILKILGQGGMGTVYLCENSRLGNLWAVKEVESKWENDIDFLAEPNILKNLSHTGIVRIVDIFFENDNLYIVEDYIKGKTLKEQVIGNGPLPVDLLMNLSLQLTSILDYLHSFDPPIIYRDLKPSNIMITPDNRVVLIDFGIARTYKEGQESDTVILGSRGYIAPEQLYNVQSNVQSDIYSLGATMFFMLTGQSVSLPAKPMVEENFPKHAPKGLVRMIQKAITLESENRYRDVKLVISELNAMIAYDDQTILSPSDQTILSNDNKTVLRNANSWPAKPSNTILQKTTKSIKRKHLVMIAVLACILSLVTFRGLIAGHNTPDKKELEPPASPKTNEQVAANVPKQDTVINGRLDLNEPILVGSGDNPKDKDKGKGKGKSKGTKEKDQDEDEDKYRQFILNPAATMDNSAFSMALTSLVRIDDKVITILNIQNKGDATLTLDLSQTYLVNGKNELAEIDDLDSNHLVFIPRSSSKQELKLTFKDFDFEGSPYTLKTILRSDVNKTIHLTVEVKGN